MFQQLLFGTLMIILTVLVQVGSIGIAMKALTSYGHWIAKPPYSQKLVLVLVVLVLWLVLGLSVSSWVWAALFIQVNLFTSLEESLYFSVVTFTTLGYGDVTLPQNWRLLGSLAAVNGLIIVGLNTAFLVEAIGRIHKAQLK